MKRAKSRSCDLLASLWESEPSPCDGCWHWRSAGRTGRPPNCCHYLLDRLDAGLTGSRSGGKATLLPCRHYTRRRPAWAPATLELEKRGVPAWFRRSAKIPASWMPW